MCTGHSYPSNGTGLTFVCGLPVPLKISWGSLIPQFPFGNGMLTTFQQAGRDYNSDNSHKPLSISNKGTVPTLTIWDIGGQIARYSYLPTSY
jgi:hypothetical protein